ncbi:hypothetical protein ACA910_017733 [Epithemia clementina (nom. ined.)]
MVSEPTRNIAVCICFWAWVSGSSFRSSQAFTLIRESRGPSSTKLASSVGDGRPPSGDGRSGKGPGSWDDFFRGEESENLLRAKEYFSENSLPINFEAGDNDTANAAEDVEGRRQLSSDNKSQNGDTLSSSLIPSKMAPQPFGMDKDMLATNPYVAAVSKVSPSDLIAKFTRTAHPRVQNAVRNTILSLIGGLPKMAFETTTITTGQRLASLMFQLQMTGYMFKNAEYRLSLQQSLGSSSDLMDRSTLLLKGDAEGASESSKSALDGKIKGKLRVKYGGKEKEDNATSLEVEVDAAAYMSELRSEVKQLRDELMVTRKEKEEALRKDLLVYIRTLPEQELRSLTNTISQDVLVAMKGLVNAVMSGIGDGQIGPNTVTEQSGEAMAQLCMWQLCIGYNLRTLEVREEMKKSLVSANTLSIRSESDDSIGAFE